MQEGDGQFRSPSLQLLGRTYRADLSELPGSFVLWRQGGAAGYSERAAGLPKLHLYGELTRPAGIDHVLITEGVTFSINFPPRADRGRCTY